MTDLIVDASVVCSWILPDETSPISAKAFGLLQTGNALAPDLLWHEVRNVLISARRRQRIDFDMVREGLHTLRGLQIAIHTPAGDGKILDLAERHRLTAYDAAYLALAMERGLPLATLDKRLAEAAARESVPLIS